MNQEITSLRIAMADDHVLLRTALAGLINSFDNHKVVIEASTGEELLNSIKAGIVPDIVLLDLNMPILGGRETAKILHEDYPDILVIMLTMYDTEISTIQLLQHGVRGFLRKDAQPHELKLAIRLVAETGYFHSHTLTGKLISILRNRQENSSHHKSVLTATELTFLKFSCTELTYKEIANQMGVNPRAIDNIRDGLFDKLDVKSRVGLAMFALKHAIVTF